MDGKNQIGNVKNLPLFLFFQSLHFLKYYLIKYSFHYYEFFYGAVLAFICPVTYSLFVLVFVWFFSYINFS